MKEKEDLYDQYKVSEGQPTRHKCVDILDSTDQPSVINLKNSQINQKEVQCSSEGERELVFNHVNDQEILVELFDLDLDEEPENLQLKEPRKPPQDRFKTKKLTKLQRLADSYLSLNNEPSPQPKKETALKKDLGNMTDLLNGLCHTQLKKKMPNFYEQLIQDKLLHRNSHNRTSRLILFIHICLCYKFRRNIEQYIQGLVQAIKKSNKKDQRKQNSYQMNPQGPKNPRVSQFFQKKIRMKEKIINWIEEESQNLSRFAQTNQQLINEEEENEILNNYIKTIFVTGQNEREKLGNKEKVKAKLITFISHLRFGQILNLNDY